MLVYSAHVGHAMEPSIIASAIIQGSKAMHTAYPCHRFVDSVALIITYIPVDVSPRTLPRNGYSPSPASATADYT